jgi:hypothetical protein
MLRARGASRCSTSFSFRYHSRFFFLLFLQTRALHLHHDPAWSISVLSFSIQKRRRRMRKERLLLLHLYIHNLVFFLSLDSGIFLASGRCWVFITTTTYKCCTFGTFIPLFYIFVCDVCVLVYMYCKNHDRVKSYGQHRSSTSLPR